MRTTIDLDDDLVLVTKELAERRRTTMGRIVSDMVRQALEPASAPRMRNGVPLFTPKKGVPRPSMALVNRLRDGE
jgi:hypothetical protein